VLAKVIEQLGGAAQVEQQPRMEGRNMSILLAPKHSGG
jgi:translation initiation factor IF-3